MLNKLAVRFQFFSIATAVALAYPMCSLADEQPAIEGKWETAAVESSGKAEPKAEWVQLAWHIQGKKLAIIMKGVGGQPERVGRYELQTADGKIDIKTDSGVVFCGLVKREGDSLVVALNASATRRPEKFESKGKGSADFVITFKPKK